MRIKTVEWYLPSNLRPVRDTLLELKDGEKAHLHSFYTGEDVNGISRLIVNNIPVLELTALGGYGDTDFAHPIDYVVEGPAVIEAEIEQLLMNVDHVPITIVYDLEKGG